MYELEQVGANTYYIDCPAKIGVYLGGADAYLIDSGSDKDTGRKIRQIFDKNGWNLKAVFNTHSNADHIGGNKYLQGQTGCKIYARGIERDFTKHPILKNKLNDAAKDTTEQKEQKYPLRAASIYTNANPAEYAIPSASPLEYAL